MAISLVASLTAAPGGSGGTTAAIDTTGADLLTFSCAYYSGLSPTLTVSDSKGNTWIGLTDRAANERGHRYYYAKNATVGTGHTFTVSATAFFAPGLVIQAW